MCDPTLSRMPTSQGYTIEAQLTGKKVVGELMFKITPAFCKCFSLMHKHILPAYIALDKTKNPINIQVETLAAHTVTVECSPDD